MISQSILKRIVGVAASLLIASASYATVIDFEGVAAPGVQQQVGNNYVESGYNFNNPGADWEAAVIGQVSQNTSGSDYYTWDSPASNNPITLTMIGGGLFSLSSLDVGSKSGSTAANFGITGYLFGGGTVFQSVTGVDNFQNLALGWSNLTHVEFAYSSGDFGAIDNLAVSSSVPDNGATIALLGGTLVLFASLRRRFVS